jgi:anti-sigma-K factor RskA
VSAPTRPTGHDEYEVLAVAWVVNALEPADQAVFEVHRAACEQCRRAVEATLAIAAELAYGVPDAVPPARLRERVLAAAAPHDRPLQPTRPPAAAPRAAAARVIPRTTPQQGASRARPGRRRHWRRWVTALAAAALVAGSAVATWEVTRPPADRVAALSAGSGTVATVVVHRDGAEVVTDMLPPNTGRGTAYYVWGVPGTDSGSPQVVGTFEVTASGLHSYRVRVTRPLDRYPVLAISEERAGQTPTTPTSVLGRGALGG